MKYLLYTLYKFCDSYRLGKLTGTKTPRIAADEALRLAALLFSFTLIVVAGCLLGVNFEYSMLLIVAVAYFLIHNLLRQRYLLRLKGYVEELDAYPLGTRIAIFVGAGSLSVAMLLSPWVVPFIAGLIP